MTLRRLACLLLGHHWAYTWDPRKHSPKELTLILTAPDEQVATYISHCLRCGEPHP